MKTISRLFYLLIALSFSTFAQAATNSSFTPEQQKQIQNIVHDYLLKNPQILLETVGKLQEQTDSQNQQRTQKVVSSYSGSLLNSPNTPILGNPNGKVTLIEFFDYQCPYCKKMTPALTKLAQTNPNLRIAMKEWPVFGEESEFAARAAIAANIQNKYLPFHEALMQTKGHISKQQVLSIAKSVGLNMTQLETDMNSKAVTDELKNNTMLSHALQLIGTPAFIVVRTNSSDKDKIVFIPGAAEPEQLQKAIQTVG